MEKEKEVTKVCTYCKKEKPLSEFGVKNNTPDGKRYHCLECHRLQRGLREVSEPDYKLNRSLWRKYRIRAEDYHKMVESQNGKCAICGTHYKDLNKGLTVDHNHETKIIRGLLCDACNTGIGLLRESRQILENAIQYLDPDHRIK